MLPDEADEADETRFETFSEFSLASNGLRFHAVYATRLRANELREPSDRQRENFARLLLIRALKLSSWRR